MKKRYKFLIVAVIIVIILSLIFYGFGAYTSDAYIRADWTEISPRIEGYVKEVFVKDNEFVKKGDRLFQLDPYVYQLRLNKLNANCNFALAKYETIKNDIDMVKQLIKDSDESLAVADLNIQRYKKLQEQNAVSIQDYQSYISDYENTKTSNDQLRRTLSQNQDLLVEQENQIELIKAERDIAKFQLEITTVVAPFDGYVTNNYLMPGLFVQQGQGVFGIAATQNPWIEANIKEYWVGRIKPGQKVWILTDLHLSKILEGRVASVRKAVNRESTQGMILPYVEPLIDWVRLEYRFTVRIEFIDLPKDVELKMGSDARVFVFFW
ncbi:MAG TPA: hypothetical protein DD381_09225 [Lentisphaeria bacterium]|nr:MAG: hypothetical protein A2X47_13580 [Lentisphaerae bacterium GWF2_38_69]HBM16504.1 hypothetical protein [Lentisphaeria bacterium]